MTVRSVSWRPKRYPITCGLNATMVARLVAIRRRERLFQASLGMGLIVFFVILGIVAILTH